ncbi:Serine/threonine-protein kinase ppk21 [Colletotrichum gloeosporioides]|uniref:Serine/threonine-protein kinase ppk21 n=1 Tax=Colletotrichum gloeosporioides TaxID=474922 RepID=A0A8H4CP15_COLGL|nr:Serine/threonine-protein kinase ppk21 [Colletotrichum gloeosporioides]KAF3807344.1 Serine/threonine-protein kinase ppk21 [Colletotrichum gloeosporioides]
MGHCGEVINHDDNDNDNNDEDEDSNEVDDQIPIRGHGPSNKIGWHDAQLEHILIPDFDVQFNLRSLYALNLRRYPQEELTEEEVLGEGETYVVKRCAVKGGDFVAVKQLKINDVSDDKLFRRRLGSVIFEAQIMRHPPLRAHPNLPSALGYGWSLRGASVIPYLVVEYAPLGTLREHIKAAKPSLADVEILLGDVSSALSAIHTCGIVHGDVKLDNALVFPSWDRPTQALAKITDFGHAIILEDKAASQSDEIVKYGGTLLYNAPEVKTQDLFPIERKDLLKCDIWAFGLMVWEACLGGQEYTTWLANHGNGHVDKEDQNPFDPLKLLDYAKQCMPAKQLGTAMFIRIVLHRTIQADPLKRASSVRDLPLYTRWTAGDLRGLEADLALHFDVPTPTYEMFRLDSGKEVLWDHQQQIFKGLQQTHSSNQAKEKGPISWQIALCYYLGFGTERDLQKSHKFAKTARSEGHHIAAVFGDLFDSETDAVMEPKNESYVTKLSGLLRAQGALAEEMPALAKAFFDGDPATAMNLLSEGASLASCTSDGCGPFHWLFMIQDPAVLEDSTEKLSGELAQRLVNVPASTIREAHLQWPTQLLGTPLAFSISVNCLLAVKTLLALGADPFAHAYDESQCPPEDSCSQWTALHIAAKYHCSDILRELKRSSESQNWEDLGPLGCVLGLSTPLERLAMHGSSRTSRLDETIMLIKDKQSLNMHDSDGRTAIMEAIDLPDADVVAALLRAEPGLANTPLRSPHDPNIFTYPLHFACQLAARRNVSDALLIPKLIESQTGDLQPSTTPSRDYLGRTVLHLAVTGASGLITKWILESRPGLLHVEDKYGRAPLHYCASSANCDLLLEKGVNIDHTDKEGLSALHRACLMGACAITEGLLKKSPILDLRNNVYGTPLHCAVISGSADVVNGLLDAGAPINATDLRGNTAVHIAAKLNRYSILRSLLARGADVTLLNLNGHDAKAVALRAASTGNIGILSILRGTQATNNGDVDLEFGQEDTVLLGREGQVGEALAPDFLWDEASLSLQQPYDTLDLPNNAKQEQESVREETYDERVERLQSLDQAIEMIIGHHFSGVPHHHWAEKAVVNIVSIFFDDILWQPGTINRGIEIVARAAYDLATVMHFYYDESWGIHHRVEAWAEYLVSQNGIGVPLRLGAIRVYPKGVHPRRKTYEASQYGMVSSTSKDDLLYGFEAKILSEQDRLEAVWKYMEENDPSSLPLGEDEKAVLKDEDGKPVRLEDGMTARLLRLPPVFAFMEQKFPVAKVQKPSVPRSFIPNREIDGLVLHDPGNLLRQETPDGELGDEKTAAGEQARAETSTLVDSETKDDKDDKDDSEEDDRDDENEKNESDDDNYSDSHESGSESQLTMQDQPDCRPKYEPCQQVSTWCSHLEQAVDRMVTLFVDRKPREVFPARQKSDIEAMVRWEMKVWEAVVPQFGVTRYTSTLEQCFPQLSGQSWRESASRSYLAWKERSTPALRESVGDEHWNSEAKVARDEFYIKLYAACHRKLKERFNEGLETDSDSDDGL